MPQNINFEKNEYCYKIYVNDKSAGFCNFVMLENESNIYITYLEITHDCRNNGLGSVLLKEVLKDAYKKGISSVKLTDASDNCRRQHNIYKKIGLHYRERDGDGEMIGNLRHIIRRYVSKL